MCDEQQHHSIPGQARWGSGGGLRVDSVRSHHSRWDRCSCGESLDGTASSSERDEARKHMVSEDRMMHVKRTLKQCSSSIFFFFFVSGHVYTQETQVRYLLLIFYELYIPKSNLKRIFSHLCSSFNLLLISGPSCSRLFKPASVQLPVAKQNNNLSLPVSMRRQTVLWYWRVKRVPLWVQK